MSSPVSPRLLLSVEGLEAVYSGSIAALHGVAFSVPRGGITAVLGANGAGKTTALKALSNLLPAQRGRVTAGRILFDGEDIRGRSPGALTRMGLIQVLEGRHCFPSLTVEENLITGGLGRSGRRREIAEDLAKVYTLFPRLKEKRRALAGLTSGGEQQMTAIGRALLSRPRLLVLDEPSMGLAPLTVQTIFRALQVLNEAEGLTILVAEQNAAIALRFAHRVTVLESGITVLEGSAEELRVRGDLQSFYLGGHGARTGAPATSLVSPELLLQQHPCSSNAGPAAGQGAREGAGFA